MKTYFSDIKLFLILIPLINIINYYLTYSNIKLDWFLLLTFSIDTAQGYLAWWGIRSFIRILDQKIPYNKSLIKRIVFQIISTLIIGLSIIVFLTELLSWIVKGKSAPLHFYTHDIMIISIWVFVINGIYIGAHFYNQWRNAEEKYQQDRRRHSEGFIVNQGNKKIKLTFEQIVGFYVDGDYSVVCTLKNEKYYLDLSLSRIEKKLPKASLFRLNRQFILHRKMISGFKRIENGKILILVNQHDLFPSQITVSRTKVSTFKKWFQPE